MTTQRFLDKFDRADGGIGVNYTVPCGAVELFDESILPVDVQAAQVGSPVLDSTTEQKTQVLFTADDLDGPDYAVRAVWSHLQDFIGIATLLTETQNDPAFTLMARMTKDPLLVDLGGDEEPLCFDQGYGLRVTCPRDGSAPILKFIKYTPVVLPPGIPAAVTLEVDQAVVLATKTLATENLAVDPDWDGEGDIQYQGFYQSMRFRIRRADDKVLLDAYLNDRNLNTPVMSFEDFSNPLWGAPGAPGFEFISAAKTTQVATSPFNLEAVTLMACHLFEVETTRDIAPSRVAHPSNRWTYDRCAQGAILIAEKQGDAKYTASFNGQTKLAVFRDFIYWAEKEILRIEGFWRWLLREGDVFLEGDQRIYELPENLGEAISISPGNWSAPPLAEVESTEYARILTGFATGSGRPRLFRYIEPGPNLRKRIEVFPVPVAAAAGQDAQFLHIKFYTRHLEPIHPESQVPFVPQEFVDALIYKAASEALLLDTDIDNQQAVQAIATQKIASMVRENNRKYGGRTTVMRSASDVFKGDVHHRIPQLRVTQLDNLLL
jgi:hypothetical protein